MGNGRRHRRQQGRSKVIVAGDGIIASTAGEVFQADDANARLAHKEPGRHRFVATACYALSDEDVRHMFDADKKKYLTSSNLWYLGIGCIDCEQVLGEQIEMDSVCPAEAYNRAEGV